MREIVEIREIKGLLGEIPDCPQVLYAQGNTELLFRDDFLYICIVGPRKASQYGKEVVKLIIEHLAQFKVITVSGAAYGIDGLVHTYSIHNQIPTIAVPGSGINDESFYPRAHLDLKHEIIENQGLVTSEFHPLAVAGPWTFPIRNRIMAGMSHLTIVVEAEKKSGTLITAHLAVDYNRDVLAVPGSIFSPTSQGTLELISKGAEIFLNVNTLTESILRLAKILNINPWKTNTLTKEIDTLQTLPLFNENHLNETERKVFKCIQDSLDGIDKDELKRQLRLSISVISICISLLELLDLVAIQEGKIKTKKI